MKCTNCLALAEPTDWTPPEGYDPFLVQYKCTKCGSIFYEPRGKLLTKYGEKKKTYNR